MGRIVSVADLETTGFYQHKGDRIIEWCFQLYDYDSRALLRTFTERVNPLRDIPAGASKVHGIYIEDLANAPTWEQSAPKVAAILQKTDCMVCHNLGFDGPFMVAELMRIGQPVKNVQTYCTMENARWATGTGKIPKLSELAWSLGVDYDPAKAHAAEYDVSVTAQCLWKGIDAGYFHLPI